MPLPFSKRDELYKEINERFVCLHDRRELRYRVIKGGSVAYVRQCPDCGDTSSPVKTSVALKEADGEPIPDYDENAENNYHRLKQEAFKEAERQLQGEVSTEYKEYLQSLEWDAKRRRVLRRAGGLCEGCLERPATQVHHHNYQNLGSEFMWQLSAVCNECHERLHTSKSSA